MTGVQRDVPHEDYTNLFQKHTPNGLMSVSWLKLPLDITTQWNKIPTWASGEQSAKKRKLQNRRKGKRNFLVFLPLLFARWRREHDWNVYDQETKWNQLHWSNMACPLLWEEQTITHLLVFRKKLQPLNDVTNVSLSLSKPLQLWMTDYFNLRLQLYNAK